MSSNLNVIYLHKIPREDWFQRFLQSVPKKQLHLLVPEHVNFTPEIKKLADSLFSGECAFGIFSSGTTGAPKLRIHSLQQLCARFQSRSGSVSRTWFTFYSLGSFAGLQAAIQGWSEGNCVEYLDQPSTIEQDSRFIKATSPICLSGTPSQFNLLLQSLSGPVEQVTQISMGGEIVRQATLSSCAKYFPSAKIAHIYATSEVGSVVTVKDNLEGLPLSLLDGNRVKIQHDELLIKPSSSEGSNYFATGDLVKIEGERIYFTGRKDFVVTVGGISISLEAVEDVASTVSGVVASRASAIDSSIMGNLIVLEVVVDSNFSIQLLRAAFTVHNQALRPAKIKVVDAIQLTSAGKLARG